MRCGRQDALTRGYVRTCLARGKGGAAKRCNHRGRERRCPAWERETRPAEIHGEHAAEWGHDERTRTDG